jgi:hypothetical protein
MSTLQIYSGENPAQSARVVRQDNEKTITVAMRNPARQYAVNVPDGAWNAISAVPEQYKAIIEATLVEAAKSLIAGYIKEHASKPSTIPAIRVSTEAILEAASNTASGGFTKETLEQAWKESATRKAMVGKPAYKESQAYRRSFAGFEELILKLTGRNTSYTPKELDAILAKLADDDLETDFGLWVVRRVERMRNKPASAEIDYDAL